METILIVEDDSTMLRGLKDNFEFHGYRVLTADDGEAGLNAALNARPDLILLDLMLPKINGYEVCRLIRKEKLEMPIIMLTAKGEESDIVLGLNLGADDYVTKPFSIKELLARTDALLRRMRSAELEVYRFDDLELDITARKLTRGSEEIKLSPKEFRLLELFVRKPGRALSRDEILNLVWGYDSISGPRTIDRFVTTLRNKIEPDPHNPVYIHTLREIGYKFDPPQ
ncbi:MAG: response regulator transcription factor [Sedimentisphaerales bacterium]|jgi:DNA-binding response OmpR family regulator|nr:response regulator transcription factor [Sedimentisphaerales bacterium]HNY78377.1 response regulator transcription factor [Sedimentisphaerales bacterium]HOC63535.1 response regulator transcription factor [Sedimentisphaerales bacterium]HOH62844.1 response regulator transcription factor [Sedimentisphaerales bacterium]HPY49577.1 response regulator transcription factor [Sedimentisphaerales bacterium]